MELLNFDCDEYNLYPEYKLLNYLTWVSEILNCEQSWNIDTLCHQMEQMDFDRQDDIESNTSENLIVLDSTEVKNIFLSDRKIKSNLELFVRVLLKFVTNKIENFEKCYYKQIMDFVNVISCFVQVCETNNIIIIPLKIYVTKFLTDLFCILGTADAFNFTVKGAVYQPIVKIIGSFKKIEFARSFIIAEISKALKTFHNIMMQAPPNNFDTSSYEILLLYLLILKQVLEYNLKKLLFKTTINKVNKKENNTLMDINQKLTNMFDKLPEYVAFTVQDCLNLLF